jgi:hypothetical protein
LPATAWSTSPKASTRNTNTPSPTAGNATKPSLPRSATTED